jgi:hypothetical protein
MGQRTFFGALTATVLVSAICHQRPARASISTSYSASGNVAAEVQGIAASGGAGIAGSITLSGIPAGASVLQAYLYSHSYFNGGAASATFDGNNLGSTAPLASDQSFFTYRWDVTSLLSGNGTFSVSATNGDNYGAALAVAYSHPSLPSGEVFFNDGAFDFNPPNELNSTTFNASIAGTGTITNFTGADNNGGFGETGEVISFNAASVGGPLDANLGPFTSLDVDPVTALAGVNTASILSPSDQFGWSLSVLQIQGEPVGGVPEAASVMIWSLLGAAGASVSSWRRRRRRSE